MSFIGVIDSGVGGLTVLKTLRERYSCDFCYVADHAYCPYGVKTDATILERLNKITEYLEKRGVTHIVLACNTASVFADVLNRNRSVPVYGIIPSTCRKIAETTVNKQVAVLATDFTVNSGVYAAELSKYGVTAAGVCCSRLVPFVENCNTTSISCLQTVRDIARQIPDTCDTVALCCTHFPLLKRQIAQYVKNAKIAECCPPDICGVTPSEKPFAEYLTTGNVDFANAAAKWYGAKFIRISL